MLHYEHKEDLRQGRITGAIATIVYAIVLLLVFLLVRFNFDSEDLGDGLILNFGDAMEAAPGSDLALNDQVAQMQQPQTASSDSEIETQDFEDAPEVPVERTRPSTPAETAPVETPREVNRRALFPGQTAGSTSTSDGTGQGAGNQGDPAGTPDGDHAGMGSGTSGNSASLQGRTLVGGLPRPEYNVQESGRVIISITVDQQGRVTNAVHRPQGSTTRNASLIEAALRAARQARFNVKEDAPITQQGTITYNFTMQ